MLRVNNDGAKVTFLLDTETGLPVRSRYSEMNPQTGQRQQAETVYSDWNTVDGITYAYVAETFVDGEKAATINVETHGSE